MRLFHRGSLRLEKFLLRIRRRFLLGLYGNRVLQARASPAVIDSVVSIATALVAPDRRRQRILCEMLRHCGSLRLSLCKAFHVGQCVLIWVVKTCRIDLVTAFLVDQHGGKFGVEKLFQFFAFRPGKSYNPSGPTMRFLAGVLCAHF